MPTTADTDRFRLRFAAALTASHDVCVAFLDGSGLDLAYKRIAVEISLNLLKEYLQRLPAEDRRQVAPRLAQSIVAAAMETRR